MRVNANILLIILTFFVLVGENQLKNLQAKSNLILVDQSKANFLGCSPMASHWTFIIVGVQ